LGAFFQVQERVWKMTAAASVAGWVRDDVLVKRKGGEDDVEEIQRRVAQKAAEAVSGFWYGVKMLDEEKDTEAEVDAKERPAEGGLELGSRAVLKAAEGGLDPGLRTVPSLEQQGSAEGRASPGGNKSKGGRFKSAKRMTSLGKNVTVEKPISGAGHAGVMKEEALPVGENRDGIVEVSVLESDARQAVELGEGLERGEASLGEVHSVREYALRMLHDQARPFEGQGMLEEASEREFLWGPGLSDDPLVYFVPAGSMAAYRALVEREQQQIEAAHELRVKEHEAAVASAQRELAEEEAKKAMNDAGLNLFDQSSQFEALNLDLNGLEDAFRDGGLDLPMEAFGVPGGENSVDPLADIPLSYQNDPLDFNVPGIPVKKKRKGDRKRKKHHRHHDVTSVDNLSGDLPTPSQSQSLLEELENGQFDLRNMFGQSAEPSETEKPNLPAARSEPQNGSHPGTPAGLNPTKRKRTDRQRHMVKPETKAVSEASQGAVSEGVRSLSGEPKEGKRRRVEDDSDDDNPIGHLIKEKQLAKRADRADPDETQPLAVRMRKKGKKKDLSKIVDPVREESPASGNVDSSPTARGAGGQFAGKRMRVRSCAGPGSG
jgi:hypothetical protein